MKASDLSFNYENGMLVISTIHKNQLVTRKYSGYSKREASRRFIEEVGK